MIENKGDLQKYFLEQFARVIILLLIILLFWIWWKALQIKFEKQERERLGLLKIEEYKKAIEKQKEQELQRKKDLEVYINTIDLVSDKSLTKFINNKVSFDDLLYIPDDLVSIWSKYIIDWKDWYTQVKNILKENLEKLSKQFYLDTNNNIVVVSWYRSYSYQKWIKDRWCSDALCAKAWYSEHQSGLAIDIYSASSEKNWVNDNNLQKYYNWFKDNAYKFGFHNTYQKWLEVDWYTVEPWHWRYLWVELATYLYENDITFAEFYNLKK